MLTSILLVLVSFQEPTASSPQTMEPPAFREWLDQQCQQAEIKLPGLDGAAESLDTGGIAAVVLLSGTPPRPVVHGDVRVASSETPPPREPSVAPAPDPKLAERPVERVSVILEKDDGSLVTCVGPQRLTSEESLAALCRRLEKGNPDARYLLIPRPGVTHQEALRTLHTIGTTTNGIPSVVGVPPDAQDAPHAGLLEVLTREPRPAFGTQGDVLIVLDANQPFAVAQEALQALGHEGHARIAFAARDREGNLCKLPQHLSIDRLSATGRGKGR